MIGILAAALLPGPDRADGEILASGIWLLLVLWGIWKCVSIARRPGTNTKCVTSLGILLGSWLFSKTTTLVVATGLVGDLVGVFAAILMVVLQVIAATVAVLGLLELRSEPSRYVQGRKQAAWTLVLSMLTLTFIGHAAYQGYRDRDTLPDELRSADARPGRLLRFPECNARLREPPRPWVKMDASKLNPDAMALFSRADLPMFWMAIGEELDAQIGNEALAEIVKANATSVARSVAFDDPRPRRLNGMDGLVLRGVVERRDEGRMLFWVCSRNGFAYQLSAWSKSDVDESVFEREVWRAFGGFQLLDPERYAAAAEPLPRRHRSTRFGYELDLTGYPWGRWSALADDFPEAEFGVLTDRAALVVVPVALGERRLAMDVLAPALLALLDVETDQSRLSAPRPVTIEGFEARDYELVRDVGSLRCNYRMRVVVGAGRAWLIASWVDQGAQVSAQEQSAWLDGFRPEVAWPGLAPSAQQPAERGRQAAVLRAAGLVLAARGDAAAGLPLLRDALELEPDGLEHRLALMFQLLSLERHDEVVAVAEQGLERYPGDQVLRSYRAYANAHRGLKDLAVQEYLELLEDGYRDPDDLRLCIDLLWEDGRRDAAFALLDTVAGGSDTLELTILRADLQRRAGEPERALELLLAERERRPPQPELDYALADAYQAAGRFQEARELCADLIARGVDTPRAYDSKASAEYALGWHAEARDTLQEALIRHASNAPLREFLDHVSGMLGEGESHLLRSRIDPIPIPDELRGDGATAEEEARWEAFGAYYLDDTVGLEQRSPGEWVKTRSVRVRILSSVGASRFSSLSFPLDPFSETVCVNEVLVRDADGAVQRADPSRYHVVDGGSPGQASQEKLVSIPVPGVAPGCTVEATLSWRWSSDDLPFFSATLASSPPALRCSAFVNAPPSAFVEHASDAVAIEREEGRTTWSCPRPPTFLPEPLMDDYQAFLPMVVVGAAGTSWVREARRYEEELGELLELDERTREAASSVTEGLEGDEARTLALARFVQGRLSYKALEFGRRAWIPNPAARTLEDRYGDCKDHALLFHQLLRAQGIVSHLALVHVSDPVVPAVPSLDQFDHMIVYCPDFGGEGRFFDTTDKYVDQSVPVPVGLARRPALVLDGERTRWIELGEYPPELFLTEASRDVRVQGETRVEVEERATLHGYSGGFMRAYLAAADAVGHREVIQHVLDGEWPGCVLRTIEVEGQREIEGPLTLRLSYGIENALRRDGERLLASVPAVWERIHLTTPPVEERRTPFRQRYPKLVRTRTTLHAPEGMRLVPAASPGEAGASGPFGSFSCRAEEGPTARTVLFSASLGTGAWPAGSYAAYRALVAQALRAVEQPLVFER